jgi:hypothetical protein
LKKLQSEPKNLSIEQIEDLKLAAAKMSGAKRREFAAQMTNKYCQGSARKAERAFGWKRNMVELGLAEQRTGIKCVGAQSAKSGVKRWEEQQPEAAKILREMAEAHGQQDPTFKTTIAYTRLTATQAIIELRQRGYEPAHLKVVVSELSFSIGWWSLHSELASQFNYSTIRLITASIIQLNDVGGFWNSIGMVLN